MIRVARKIRQLKSSQLLTGGFVGFDGRLHPEHTQLGAGTGRQSSKNPNILGIGGVLRPLVVPATGYGIGEADYSQIEIGIAAEIFQDQRLEAMYNTGDVYSAMAQDFFASKLAPEDQQLSGADFKRKYPKYRASMKPCALGIIYGLTAHGLGQQLGISVPEAEKILERFLGMFSELKEAKFLASELGQIRGWATTITGLRRYRGRKVPHLRTWERNWMANHPVQGTAAAIFKDAGNRLRFLYRQYDAHLIIPLHDAYIFEAPLDVLKSVADLTADVMCKTVQKYFPALESNVEVNIEHPDCWNKDGDANSLERWLKDPFAEIE